MTAERPRGLRGDPPRADARSATAGSTSTAWARRPRAARPSARRSTSSRATRTRRGPLTRRCTATSRRPSSPTPTATPTSATRPSSTSRCAACSPTRSRATRRAMIGDDRAPDAAARRRPVAVQRGGHGRPRRSRSARPRGQVDDAPDGRRPLRQRRLLHVHDRADRRQRHRRAGPRLPAQQRADRLQLRPTGTANSPDGGQAAALEHLADDRLRARAARRSRSARRAARRSSPPSCRSSSTTSTSGRRLPDALAAPRASSRNSASIQSEPGFIAGRPTRRARPTFGHVFSPNRRRDRRGDRHPLPAPRRAAGGRGADPPRRRVARWWCIRR